MAGEPIVRFAPNLAEMTATLLRSSGTSAARSLPKRRPSRRTTSWETLTLSLACARLVSLPPPLSCTQLRVTENPQLT